MKITTRSQARLMAHVRPAVAVRAALMVINYIIIRATSHPTSLRNYVRHPEHAGDGWIWQDEQRAHVSYVRSLDLATAVAGPMKRSPWTGWCWNCGGGDWDWRWNESGWRWSGGWRWNGWSWNRGNVA